MSSGRSERFGRIGSLILWGEWDDSFDSGTRDRRGNVDVPLGWVPLRKRTGVGYVALLDTGPFGRPWGLGVRDAGVLVDLAEQVLVVDEVKLTTPQLAEGKTEPVELGFAQFVDRADEVSVVQARRVGEALADTATSPRSRDDKVHFGEVDQGAVVEIDGELERKERAYGRIGPEDVVNVLEGIGIPDACGRSVAEHEVQEAKVVAVLSWMIEGRTRHDVGGGVDGRVRVDEMVEGERIAVGVESVGSGWTELLGQVLPSLDLVEEFEQEASEEDLVRGLFAGVENLADEVLADTIGGPVGVGEAVGPEDGVSRPGFRCRENATHEEILAARRELPVGVEDRGGLKRAARRDAYVAEVPRWLLGWC